MTQWPMSRSNEFVQVGGEASRDSVLDVHIC